MTGVFLYCADVTAQIEFGVSHYFELDGNQQKRVTKILAGVYQPEWVNHE